MDSSRHTTPRPSPIPTLTSVATIPVAILAALSQAIVGWTSAVYPGKTAHLEVASRDAAAHRPHTWQATARLSNGMRLRFTVVIHDDGAAWVTRYARLPGTDAAVRADLGAHIGRVRGIRDSAARPRTPPHGWAGRKP